MSITRTCQAVVARVVIAVLAVAIPLAVPLLTHEALATISADHAGPLTARIVHQDRRPAATSPALPTKPVKMNAAAGIWLRCQPCTSSADGEVAVGAAKPILLRVGSWPEQPPAVAFSGVDQGRESSPHKRIRS